MKAISLQLVVFDMAGTTVDEDNVVYKTLQQCITQQGVDVTLQTVLDIGAGQEKKQAIRDILSAQGLEDTPLEETTERAYAAFIPALETAYHELHVKPMPGAAEVFSRLRKNGIRVALNTGYQRQTAEDLLQQLNWSVGRDIDLLVTADMVEQPRPAPDMIDYARQKLSITDPARVAKIGDSGIDIEEGQNAGCGLILGITTGAQNATQLEKAQPDGVIDQLTELLDWIKL